MSTNTNVKSNKITSMSAAGEQLLKMVVSLYDSEVFVREGKALREQLICDGVDACSVLASVSTVCTRPAKLELINSAVVKINRVIYTVNCMCALGLYAQKQITSLVDFCTGVLRALKQLLEKVPETRRVIRVRNPLNVVNVQPAQDGEDSADEVGLNVGSDADFDADADLDSIFIEDIPSGFDDPV